MRGFHGESDLFFILSPIVSGRIVVTNQDLIVESSLVTGRQTAPHFCGSSPQYSRNMSVVVCIHPYCDLQLLNRTILSRLPSLGSSPILTIHTCTHFRRNRFCRWCVPVIVRTSERPGLPSRHVPPWQLRHCTSRGVLHGCTSRRCVIPGGRRSDQNSKENAEFQEFQERRAL